MFDTKEEIEKALKQGLSGLTAVIEYRQAQLRDKEQNQWVVLNRFFLDQFGQIWRLDKFNEDEEPDKLVMSLSDFSYPLRMHSTRVPTPSHICDRCRNGWSLHNIHDYLYMPPGSTWDNFRHTLCQNFYSFEESQNFFKSVLSEAGVTGNMHAIPNQYRKDSFSPWFIVDTIYGDLVIGWRKRVINIDWSLTTIPYDGTWIFRDEDVTVEKTLVHAWGRDKCVEYLRKLFFTGNLPEK